MATEKWIAGSLNNDLNWHDAFSTATLNSLVSGNAILSDLAINNSTPLDVFMDISIGLASAVFAAPNFVGVYLYPLNADATTYGDGRFGSGAAGPPSGNYFVGNIGLVVGTQAQTGSYSRIVLPPGQFKYVLYNQGGVNWAASGNTCQYRCYDRSIV